MFVLFCNDCWFIYRGSIVDKEMDYMTDWFAADWLNDPLSLWLADEVAS